MCGVLAPPAVCEMCGIVGTREAFFSKTKRFCSVSCSRSYSSNSKKASILARLQVRAASGALSTGTGAGSLAGLPCGHLSLGLSSEH